MKKNVFIFSLTAIFLLLLLVTSCDDKPDIPSCETEQEADDPDDPDDPNDPNEPDDPNDPDDPDDPNDPTWPKEVSFTAFTPRNICWRTDVRENEIAIINSHEELGRYLVISCPDLPPIDFSKQTLLLASGMVPGYIYCFGQHPPISSLLQLYPNKYKLDIELRSSNESNNSKWIIALLVDKLCDNSSVELNTTTLFDEERWVMEHDDSASIVGKWQLVRIVHHTLQHRAVMLDQIPYNIVYEFKPNGIVTITKNQNFEEEHPYSMVDIWPFTLEMGDWYYAYAISLEKMVLHGLVSSTRYRFVRID